MSDPKNEKAKDEKAGKEAEPKSSPREGRTIVKLTHAYQSNNAGEVCGFPNEVAAQLIERKHAVKHKP